MTREETVRNLLSELTDMIDNGSQRDLDRADEIGASIIKLFEQEPTTKNDFGVDWESYKDADGNSLDDLILEVLQNNFDCGNTYGYKVADEIIELLPSLTPQEPRWIPVSEKLPKPFTFVNVTCRSLVDDRENWVIETIYLPVPKEANKHGYSDWGDIPMLNFGEAEVIAWVERVIPQPYKAESEPQESEDINGTQP